MTNDATFWNRQAQAYAKRPVRNPDSFEQKIAITRSWIKPEHVILDIGCGTGSLALRLCTSAAHVHGLDISTEMVRIARGKAAAQSAANVTFYTSPFDGSFTVLKPGTLDGVCVYNALHFFDDRAAALAQIFELLRPGGFFISSTACLGSSWIPFGPLIRCLRVFGQAPRVNLFSKSQLLDDIHRAGFAHVVEPEVGAKAIVAFIVASKPE